jgi:hypothetical protein
MQASPADDGVVLAGQGTHAVCRSLGTVVGMEPSRAQGWHGPPSLNSLPLHGVQSLWSVQPPGFAHSLPGAHVNGGTHAAKSLDGWFGGKQRWHTPKAEKLPSPHGIHSDRSEDGSVPAPQGTHAVRALLDRSPRRLQAMHSPEPSLTVPLRHGVHSLWSVQPSAAAHSVPGAHVNSSSHRMPSRPMSGGIQAVHDSE